MEGHLIAKFRLTTIDDKSFGHWLAETLKEFGMGRNQEETIADKLEALARDSEEGADFYGGRYYYRLAGGWFRAAGRGSRQTDMTVAAAEGYVKEAEARMSSDNPSALVAVGFYDGAIQTYREIPRTERQPRRIDERIAELMQLHQEAGEMALGEMKTVSTPGPDISRTVQQARAAVRGNPPREALQGARVAGYHRCKGTEGIRPREPGVTPIHRISLLDHARIGRAGSSKTTRSQSEQPG